VHFRKKLTPDTQVCGSAALRAECHCRCGRNVTVSAGLQRSSTPDAVSSMGDDGGGPGSKGWASGLDNIVRIERGIGGCRRRPETALACASISWTREMDGEARFLPAGLPT
jgi:hypothetical protein